MPVKIVIAQMSHETNTFSPIPTSWERFELESGNFGDDAIEQYKGTNSPVAAYIDLAQELGAQIEVPLVADAAPSGFVDDETYEFMANTILDAVCDECDGIMLDLHGAMVPQSIPDGEGDLLKRIRTVAPNVPICVTLDLHANVSQDMIDNCNAIIGYKTYPHVDMYDVGLKVGRILISQIEGKIIPVMAWGNRPMLPHTLLMGHEFEPMKGLQEMAREAENAGILAVSVFGGFPLADVEFARLSAVAVADGDESLARQVVDQILDSAWDRREEFVYHGQPLPDAVAQAKKLKDGPIVLLDHADNCASGGTQDVMVVIKEVLDQGLEDVAVFAVWDPNAVKAMTGVGIGASVTLELGGKRDMPSIGMKGKPLEVSGRVQHLSDGKFVVRGPMSTGMTVRMGPTAVLETGSSKIVVISRHVEPWDLAVFTSVGIDPNEVRYLLLKSRVHWRAGFGSIAKAIIPCDGFGVTSSDYSLFEFHNLRRPIYPLDQFPKK